MNDNEPDNIDIDSLVLTGQWYLIHPAEVPTARWGKYFNSPSTPTIQGHDGGQDVGWQGGGCPWDETEGWD